jgi:hypothetical protein
MMVIDLLGLNAKEVRSQFPEVYQHLLETVKPERDKNNRASYRDNWWLFGATAEASRTGRRHRLRLDQSKAGQ